MPRRRARKKKSLAISGRTDAVAHPLAVDLSKADRTHGVRHVAIIMDGNGRWAKKRLLPRFAGHKAGVEAVRRTARAAREMGLEVLTLYAFSSENWKRPESEVGRSEEHTSELQSLMRISYAVFCLKKKSTYDDK